MIEMACLDRERPTVHGALYVPAASPRHARRADLGFVLLRSRVCFPPIESKAIPGYTAKAMAYIDFISKVHRKTKRDYLARVCEYPKAAAAALARQWGKDYWDGDRRVGYGGMRYDGRWRAVADAMATHYGLKAGDSILDVGCGKGFLLYDFTQAVPGIVIQGLDISEYAVIHSKDEVRPFLTVGSAVKLPFTNKSFDLVISLNTLHNLQCFELDSALREIERVGKNKYIVVESYRDENEKANLLYWQLTCESFHRPEGWEWWFGQTGYSGDHAFIYFD
jgi:SAM-dependent methyltransferase